MLKTEFIIAENDSGRRLDRVVRKFLADVSLSSLYAAIRKGRIKVNGKRVALNYKTAVGDTLSIADDLLPVSFQKFSGEALNTRAATASAPVVPAVPVRMDHPDIPILVHTTDLFIINKPAGIAVHGEGSLTAKLLPWLLSGERGGGSLSAKPGGMSVTDVSENRRFKSLSFTPGPLHRLDKNTTGALCFSQSLAGAQWFSQCLRERTIEKYYLGVIRGTMPPQLISTHDEGGTTLTDCYPLAYHTEQDVSLMLFRLITGKKHQIRKHVQSVGHPLAGDTRYGGGKPLTGYTRYLLHAWRLSFPEQRPDGIPSFIEAPLFPDMAALCIRLFPQWQQQADAVLQRKA